MRRINPEHVIKRNRRHPAPLVWEEQIKRPRRTHREDHHRMEVNTWHQPGRRYGPSPLGPDHPKANKLTDRDGNPRIAPMQTTVRLLHYQRVSGRHAVAPDSAAGEAMLTARRRAALLGVTVPQARRLAKKANKLGTRFHQAVR